MVAAAVAGAAIVGGVMSSDAQRSAGNKAADAQTASAQAGIAEQQRQFDSVQKLLAPYAQAGTGALAQQQNMLGLNGPGSQQQAIDALQQTPYFQSQLKLGNDNILQNAAATGGLRGGNTQRALALLSPQLLAQTFQQQFGNLGGITSIGQNAAAMTGNAGMQTGQGISSLLQQQGAAQAGGYLNAGRAQQGLYNSVGNAFGAYQGMGGFNGLGNGPAAPTMSIDPNGIGITPANIYTPVRGGL